MLRRSALVVLAASAILGHAACGGSSSPGSPSGGGGGGTTNPLPGEAATITILPTGTTPKVVTVPVGSRVNFVNESGLTIEVSSDPHPIHTDCPPLNIGALRTGQTGQTGVLNIARTCQYHDHGRSEDARWQGSIVIQ